MNTEFANFSQVRQQQSFTLDNLWVVSRIAGLEELTLTAVHGPSGVEVSSIPLTMELVHSFGFWVRVLRGGLCTGGTDRALVRKASPNLYVQRLHAMTKEYRELIPELSEDDELFFHAELAQHDQWKAGERDFWTFLDERPHAVRKLLNQSIVPLGKRATFAWLHFWHALAAQLAKMAKKLPL